MSYWQPAWFSLLNATFEAAFWQLGAELAFQKQLNTELT